MHEDEYDDVLLDFLLDEPREWCECTKCSCVNESDEHSLCFTCLDGECYG